MRREKNSLIQVKNTIRTLIRWFPFVDVLRVKCGEPIRARYYFYIGKIRIYPIFLPKRLLKKNGNSRVVYLKINRMSDYALPCIQHWIDVAYCMKAEVVIICDNYYLKKDVLRNIRFHDSRIIIIPSMRFRLRRIVKNCATPRWQRAACAHFTPFYHAKKNRYENFWEIDADDTMLCMNKDHVVDVLCKAEELVARTTVAAMSLDMWWTRTQQKYWTWGVTYVKGASRFMEEIESISNRDWFVPYKDYDIDITADWLFTYLKDYKKFLIDTFYVENGWFIHWCNFILNPLAGYICSWREGIWENHILKYIFNNLELGEMEIGDCRKIQIEGLNYDEGRFFIENVLGKYTHWPLKLRKLVCAQEFSSVIDEESENDKE